MASFAAGRVLLQKTLSRSRPPLAARKSFSALVTLEVEAPGVPDLTPEPKKATEASVSTLPSGLVVATENACSVSTVSMTYPKAGSGGEMIDEEGAAFVNKCMGFRSGSNMSTLHIYRSIEDAGGVPFVTADRNGATLGYTAPRETAASVVNMLAVDCSFEPWDVRDAKKFAATEAEEAGKSAQIVLTDNLYAAAYGPQSPAGRSFYTYAVNTEALQSFRDRAYGVNGAVLVATGIPDHAAFCAEVSELLSAAPAGSPEQGTPLAYLGGESRVSAPQSGYAHVALAFESTSSSVVGNIIKHALNLAGAESGVEAFSTAGLIGVYTGGENSGGLADSLLAALATPLSPETIKRAKSLAKFDALMAIDGGSKTLAETVTASVLETGSFGGPAGVAKAYESVTDSAVTSALKSTLNSNPSLAAVGDISMVPYHATIASHFK